MQIQVIRFDPAQHQDLLPSIVTLHVEACEHDDTPLRFHPPFTKDKRDKMLGFWAHRTRQIVEGERVILVAVAVADQDQDGQGKDQDQDGQGKDQDQGEAEEESAAASKVHVAGIVELGMPLIETGPFRGTVEMLIVSTSYRRRGVGRRLMVEVERVAVEQGRTLLSLSTTEDSVAQKYLYQQLGYVQYGRLPNYAIAPMTRALVHGVYFYKDLVASGEAEGHRGVDGNV